MNKRIKAVYFMLKISKVFCTVIVLANLFAPIYKDVWLRLNVFQISMTVIWIYALLSHLGFFKKEIERLSDGRVIYEQVIPIVGIGLCRLFEVLFFVIVMSNKINWVVFLVLIGADLIYLALLLFDKASYYYESKVKINDL